MRILSLLPSATEIVFALGLEGDLVGVTHECDWPPAARTKRAVSFSALPPAAEPAEVDRLVSASIDGGEPIYRLDTDAVRELRPDLVLTQDLCAVCAVPSGHVNEALELLGCRAEVLSMDPSSLGEVLDCLLRVGAVTGTEATAAALVDGLRQRLRAVTGAVAGRQRPGTFALEWSDPPFNGGHWVPEMIEAAGGSALLAGRGTPSVRVSWAEIEAASPEVVVFMPCGYGLEAAATEGASLLARPELRGAKAAFAVDASSYFSRPGPRLVDGVEILASALHPGAGPESPPGTVRRLR
ncbi:MAG TPA: cobalamin-binding protein [Acidimicrobiales bacterium]|nr:cobalamin-binding protein [Acidimicrobiales bacterium]